jgi:uncharacterized protein YcaQ
MTHSVTRKALRRQAVHTTLRAPTTLASAMADLGFVQCDPIRAPARAQDLILRHRVVDYVSGDLERCYPALALEEDFLYAYGFVPRAVQRLLHPRPAAALDRKANALAADILAFVRDHGPTHPGVLAERFGDARVVNGWGSLSKASTRALQHLHYQGLLRVQRRDNGIRVYEAAADAGEPLDPAEKLRRLCLLVTRILSPVPEATLRAVLARLAGAPAVAVRRSVVQDLLASGELETAAVERATYIWPADTRSFQTTEAPREVRLLAPFDPVVWDRARFEHLWGWAYRFEAYTPARKRRLGYYAMPLLWVDRIIGWANCSIAGDRLDVATGFVADAPRGRDFRRALDREIARMENFLSTSLDRSADEAQRPPGHLFVHNPSNNPVDR